MSLRFALEQVAVALTRPNDSSTAVQVDGVSPTACRR